MFREIIALSKTSNEALKHPLEKIILCIIPIIALGFSKSFIPLIINIIFFIGMNLIKKHSYKIVLKFSLGTALFASISAITFVFDYGIAYTLLIILKAFSAGLCIAYLSLTTPMDDILNMLHKIDALKEVCDIAKNMERFIILLEDEYVIMINSVKSRNGFANFNLKVKNMGKIAGLLFINTMKRWRDIKDAINTRCYRGELAYMAVYSHMNMKNSILIIIYLCILLSVVLITL